MRQIWSLLRWGGGAFLVVASGTMSFGQLSSGSAGTIEDPDSGSSVATLNLTAWEANGPTTARLSIPGVAPIDVRVEARTLAAARFKELFVDRAGRTHGIITVPSTGGTLETFDVSYLLAGGALDLLYSPADRPEREAHIAVEGLTNSRMEVCIPCIVGAATAVVFAACVVAEERAVASCGEAAKATCGRGNVKEWSREGGVCGMGGVCTVSCNVS